MTTTAPLTPANTPRTGQNTSFTLPLPGVSGITIERRFTTAGTDPFDSYTWVQRPAAITDHRTGTVMFAADVEVPEGWDQTAVDVLAAKYCRKAGVPQTDPATGEALVDDNGDPVTGAETSAKQVIGRMVLAWKTYGIKHGYFASDEDAQAYADEMAYMLAGQMGAPNSPQWFNTGVFEAYGIVEDDEGNTYYDPETDTVVPTSHKYERVAASACYINRVEDNLVGEAGIMAYATREARLFKGGSGSGANISTLREAGAPLTAGGTSSGALSFLKAIDKMAGAIKSGGSTRRAARMVIMDADHPDIEAFIDTKVDAETIARDLIAAGYDRGYDTEGGAYDIVPWQNANHSIRIPRGFKELLDEDADLDLVSRKTGQVVRTVNARTLWNKIAEASHYCADPGVQFDGIINDWATTPNDGKIRGSNPCSEYLHVDDSACNLASMNLGTFFDPERQIFDDAGYAHAARLWTITLEITVSMSHYPDPRVARVSYDHRTLGLGYANVGALLMRAGIAYDSRDGRAVIGAVTALMTSVAWATSAELAAAVGPCAAYMRNVEPTLRVIANHRRAAYGSEARRAGIDDYDNLEVLPVDIDHRVLARTVFATLTSPVLAAADHAVEMAAAHGVRNAQVSVLAPTGCIVPDSLLATERGLVRLDELGDPHGAQWQDIAVSVATDDGPRDATKFYSNGLSDIVTVTTRRGYAIKGTPEHRVRVVDATGEWVWKRFGEIAEGDVAPLAMNSIIGSAREVQLPVLGDWHWNADFGTKVPETMSVELAELVGYFMGDGSLHAKGLRLCVSNEDADLIARLSSHIKALFNLAVHTVPNSGYVSLEFNSVPLAAWWEAAGFAKHKPSADHTGKGWTPHIPSAIRHTNDPDIYRAFLSGLFEADGTVSGEGVPTWSSSSLSFVEEVRTLLLTLGFPTATGVTESGWGGEISRLRVFGFPYAHRFCDEIGMLSTRKTNRLQESLRSSKQAARMDWVPVRRALVDELLPKPHWSRGGANETSDLRQLLLRDQKRGTGMVTRAHAEALYAVTGDARVGKLLDYFWDTVSAAELTGTSFTYDLSVPDNVTYTANGFVSHNTIGLVMSCDTTGCEPDFALVKWKKLAGGGYMKIVNQSVPPALAALGYSPDEIDTILTYALGTGTLNGTQTVNRTALIEAGLAAGLVDTAEAALPTAGNLAMAFAPHVIGDAPYSAMNLDPATSGGFDLLRELGFPVATAVESSLVVCGHETVEGAPGLRDEDLAVFDTANRCGDGTRYIHWSGHVNALAAIQPHVSGGISKTVNLPNDATVDDIRAVHDLAYDTGVKCVAVYRDGSKASQPLSSTLDDSEANEDDAASELPVLGEIAPGMSPTDYYAGHMPPRFRLPDIRVGHTFKFEVAGQDIYLQTGVWGDGTVGELFISLAKDGSTLRGVFSQFAIAVSLGLQRGVPLEHYVDKFVGQNFAPNGIVRMNGGPLRMCSSIPDAIFRILGWYYLGRDNLVQVPDVPGLVAERGALPAHRASSDSQPSDVDVEAVAAAVVDAVSTHVPAAAPAPAVVAEPAVENGSPFTGDLCPDCGSAQMIRSGNCQRCLACSATTGCS